MKTDLFNAFMWCELFSSCQVLEIWEGFWGVPSTKQMEELLLQAANTFQVLMKLRFIFYVQEIVYLLTMSKLQFDKP